MRLLFKLTDEEFGIIPQEMNNCNIRLASKRNCIKRRWKNCFTK